MYKPCLYLLAYYRSINMCACNKIIWFLHVSRKFWKFTISFTRFLFSVCYTKCTYVILIPAVSTSVGQCIFYLWPTVYFTDSVIYTAHNTITQQVHS